MMSITPRKRRNFSLEEKVEIIRDLESGISQTRLASSKEIPRSTVQNIWSNRHKILAEFDTYLTEIKKARLPDFEEVNSIVLRWFQQRARSDSVPSEAILRVRAEQFAELYNRTDFKADYKWLSRWKIKYDINMPVNEPHKEMKRNGTRENDSPISLNLFEDIWPHFLIGYTPDNIYCAGKIGFFYRVLPDKIHTFKNEKCNSGNHAVERLTMLLCCSIDGVDRRKPLIVGKFKNPRAFKSVKNRRHLPIDYHWSSKSWMTSQVFSKWLESFDREVAAQKRKVLLILDGRPCNLEPTLLGNVQLVILPRCCSGKFSAFTVNVLKEAKRKYRGELAKKVIRKLDLNEKPTVDILEAAFMIGRAWTKVKSKTIRDSFSRSGLFPELSPLQRISKTLCRKKYENSVDDVNGGHAEVDDEGEEEEHDDEDSVDDDNYDEEEESNDDIPLGILMDWLNCSNQDITMLEYSSFDDEISTDDSAVRKETQDVDVIPSFICDETTQPIVPDHRIISTAEALESIDNLKYWLMSQEECDPSLLLKLADWENFATKRLLTELKQSIVANSVVNSSKL